MMMHIINFLSRSILHSAKLVASWLGAFASSKTAKKLLKTEVKITYRPENLRM